MKDTIDLLSSGSTGNLGSFAYLLDRCRIEVPSRVADVNTQSENELRMLQEFVAHADIAGMPFPLSSVDLDMCDFGFAACTEQERAPAQNYSMKTRTNPFFDKALKTLPLLPEDLPPNFMDELSEQDKKELDFILLRFEKGLSSLTNFTMRHPLVALAQHHGIPTRILDWSHDARKATYFAGAEIPESELNDAKKMISVFALNPFMIEKACVHEDEFEGHYEDHLAAELFLSQHATFAAKTETTSYIAAQEGLFSYPQYADLHYVLTGEYPTIDTWLEKTFDWRAQNSPKSPMPIRDYIRKITLPYSEVDELMELLDDERIMLTTLMPNLDKLKECMVSRAKRKRRLAEKGM